MNPNLNTLVLLISLFIPTLVFHGCDSPENKPMTLHLIGDSTMANKPDPDNNPERGWGQMLPLFFDEPVTIINHAAGGRSSKSFMDEGRWNNVLNMVQPGDYVVIQFGHNDQKSYDPARYANPLTAYRRNLEKYITESRKKGAVPILVSSIVRRNFNEQGTLEDTHGLYPLIMRNVANDFKVPFIDLQLKTEEMLIALGPERSKKLFMWVDPGEWEMYPEGKADNTHLSIEGATEVARLAVNEIKQINLPLSDYLSEEARYPNLLVIIGGHSYDTTEFFDLFRDMKGVQFDSISHPDALRLLTSEYLNSYDLLLFYDFMKDLPERDSSIFLNLAQKGMPMIFLHHALCSFQRWSGYMEMVGGRYVEAKYTDDATMVSGYKHDIDLHVKVLNKEHPVTRGMDDFIIHDEGYSNIQVTEGITPLLETDHPDCYPKIGWVNHHANSTIVYLMLGHDNQAYQNPAFRNLLFNSITWLSDPEKSPLRVFQDE